VSKKAETPTTATTIKIRIEIQMPSMVRRLPKAVCH
jgi:hypothetical protein